jgi:hypothetical protein
MTSFLTWERGLAYLAVGVVALYLIRMLNMWLNRTRTEGPWWEELRNIFMPNKKFDWKEALLSLLLFSLFSVAWPVIVVWISINHFSSTASWRSKLPEATFTCQQAHLRKAMTQAEAESMGAVIDPLGRAPALPFGHLNAGWQAFLGNHAEDLALWYFEVPHRPTDGKSTDAPSYLEFRGFAWVQAGKVKAEFVFEGY